MQCGRAAITTCISSASRTSERRRSSPGVPRAGPARPASHARTCARMAWCVTAAGGVALPVRTADGTEGAIAQCVSPPARP
eukprot:17654-Lingulodinium_polyedra.AAC.1